MRHPSVITAADVSCVVIPDRCVGLPTLSALEQGIPVIAVRGNTNIMKNNLEALPWARGQLHIVDNYLEAVGVRQREYRRALMLFINRKLGRRRVAEVTRADISEIHHA